MIALFPLLIAISAGAVERRVQGSLILEDVPAVEAAMAERMLQYQNTRGVSLVELEDLKEGLLIATRFAETSQLHWVRYAGGTRRQLTFFKEPVSAAALRPGGREFVYAMDRGGSENYQLYLFTRADGRSKLLTDGKSRNESPLWSPDGTRLAFMSTARNGKDFDLWIHDAATGERRLAAQLEGRWVPKDWSADGKSLLLQKYVSINESSIHRVDLERPEPVLLLPLNFAKKASYPDARFAPDGKSVYFTSDETGEFVTLGRLDLASKKVEWLSAAIPWDVEELEVGGKTVAFTVNEDGSNALYLLHKNKPRRVENLPPFGLYYGLDLSADGKFLAFIVNTPVSPPDAYVLDTGSRRITRWTMSETGGLAEESFVKPELIRYKSFDGLEVPAFFYKPKGTGPHPFVVDIHGGPESQSQPRFNPTIQYWINELGLAVLVPNVRGSSGYGKSYLLLDNGLKREDSVKDIGALLDWAAQRPELDSTRAAVYGGSYGGYMVLASLARYPDRLKAGVDIVGISNFVTFLTNTKDYRRDLRRAEYGDERDPKMKEHLLAISPTTLASHIRSRLFVVQGANDPRVPASEAEQIVKSVRAQGRPVWYMLAQDEGHGFAKKTNRDAMGQAVALFWERMLLAK